MADTTADHVPMSTSELMARLARHYIKPSDPLPGGIFVPEVGFNGGGSSRADAIYVGFTGTSGRRMIGHEVKTSRSDWLRELAKPGKADGWADQCHQWWIVATPGVVNLDELPHGWGLMEPGPKTRTRLVVKAPATMHGDRVPSWRAVRSVMARYDTLRAEAIRVASIKARNEVAEQFEERVEHALAMRTRGRPDAEALRVKLAAIEDALGFTVDMQDGSSTWNDKSMNLTDLKAVGQAALDGQTLRAALSAMARPYNTPLAGLRHQLDSLQTALDVLQEQAASTVGTD